MYNFDFTYIKSPFDFQNLCSDILLELGFENIIGSGTGPDQGLDLLAEYYSKSPLGNKKHICLVMCKHLKKHNVSENDIGDIQGYLSLHKADTLLIITTSNISGTAITKINAINKDVRSFYNIYFWTRNELDKIIIKYPHLITKYIEFNNLKNKHSKSKNSIYNFNFFKKKYKPYKKAFLLRISTFPKNESNKLIFTKIINFAKEYKKNPNKLLVIEGGTYIGKTGYAFSLINELKSLNKTAYIEHFYLFKTYVEYNYNKNSDFLYRLKFLEDIDFLIIDDFGIDIKDKTETQILFIEITKKLINKRILNKKNTILNFNTEIKISSNYLDIIKNLKNNFEFIWLGEGCYLKKNINSIAINGVYLGKSWLLEKFGNLKITNGGIIDALKTPDDIYRKKQEYMNEIYGTQPTKKEYIERLVNASNNNIDKYVSFIEQLNFDSLFFHNNGKVRLYK
jgi:DNA replication protein DnaC